MPVFDRPWQSGLTGAASSAQTGGSVTGLHELIKVIFEPAFAEVLQRNIFFLTRFKPQPAAGGEIRWKVHFAGNTAVGPYTEGASAPASVGRQWYREAYARFALNWAWVEVTGLLEAATRGGGGFKQAVAEEVRQAIEDLREQLNMQILGRSTETGRMLSIRDAISNSGTYCGIDRASAVWWQAYVLRPSSPAALTIRNMRRVKTAVEDTPRYGQVSVIVTSPAVYNAYADALSGWRRIVDSKTLDGGFKALEFDGVDVVAVPGYATEDVGSPPVTCHFMDFLTEKHFEYRVLKQFDVEEKPTQADSRKFMITHYSQFICKNPFQQGSLQLIDPSQNASY
jgi:hypothetical protein